MSIMCHDDAPAPEALALSKKDQAVRYAPYQALLERIEAWMLQRLAEDGADAHVMVRPRQSERPEDSQED